MLNGYPPLPSLALPPPSPHSLPLPTPESTPSTYTGWALAVSMSRAFGFKKLGGYALAPLIDMANHAPVSNAEVRYSDDTRRVNLIANSKVGCGVVWMVGSCKTGVVVFAACSVVVLAEPLLTLHLVSC